MSTSRSRLKTGSFDSRIGLTLLELLVVVTLLALVTATVTLRLGGSLHRVAMAQSLSQWEFTETQLRARARRAGRPVTLHLEIGSRFVECALDPVDETARTVRELGRGVRVAKFLTSTREVSHGPVAIHYTGQGTTETFAVELAIGKDRRWFIVAGITGQICEVPDETEAKKLLGLLIPAGLHAG